MISWSIKINGDFGFNFNYGQSWLFLTAFFLLFLCFVQIENNTRISNVNLFNIVGRKSKTHKGKGWQKHKGLKPIANPARNLSVNVSCQHPKDGKYCLDSFVCYKFKVDRKSTRLNSSHA